MTDALASANMQDGTANTPRTLHIRSGKPVNMYAGTAWPAAFVEFLYGDCAPNLARPRRVELRGHFHYLATREELEYSLEADRDDPLIPGGSYRAPSQSRWNTPEFMAIFADVVRKVRILQTAKHMWEGAAPKWRIDIQAICDAKVEHFEQWKQLVFSGYSHHLLYALLAVSSKDVCQLLEVVDFRIPDCLYVYPPFGRCVLPHVLCGL